MKILIIEDDSDLSSFLQDELRSKSHIVDVIDDGTLGSFKARTNQYDTIILDYALPGKDGLTICKEIRGSGKNTPIIFLSATGDEKTKVEALDLGADDYMVKPFSMPELTSRLKAISRRPSKIENSIIRIGDISIDANSQTVTKGDKIVKLTRKEFALIEFLAKNPDKTLSRSEIMDHVWSAEIDPFSNTVEAHIRTLRQKLGKREGHEIIKNISGRGYTIGK